MAGNTRSRGPRLLQGAPIAAEIRSQVKADIAVFRRRHGFAPTLAIVLVGRDAPSAVYLQQILRGCRNVGASGRLVELTGRVSGAGLRRQIQALNADPIVSGIIVQMPLPRRIPLSTVTETIDPAKDVDGIRRGTSVASRLARRAFVPTTAQAAVEMLKRSGHPDRGSACRRDRALDVVGKPRRPVAAARACDGDRVPHAHA